MKIPSRFLPSPSRLRESGPRRGVSLIEAILFAVIALVLLIVIYRFLTTGMELADESSKAIALQQGARNLVENMVRDVNACHMFAEAYEDRFTVLKYQYEDPKFAVAENVGRGNLTWPFYTNDAVTVSRLPVFKCAYKFFPDKGTVMRKIRKGILVSKTPAAGGVGDNMLRLSEFSFEDQGGPPGEPAEGRVLARKVKKFKLAFFGYDDLGDGSLKEATQLTANSLERKIAKICMVVLNFQATFEEGLYKDKLKSPEIELMTKIWSYKGINDHVYKEYFGSQDVDVRY
ncbi:MAG: hypothetical protein HY814_11755 [Candidatus Riflebacteria bacterium]|nr:hypothetical protein [Candidatus Riflebacteria bacterium]